MSVAIQHISDVPQLILEEIAVPPTGVPVASDVWRVTRADLDNMVGFLLKRLKEKFTDRDQREIMGFLMGCLDSNEYCFVRTTHAFGLAGIRQEPLESPIVREIFVLSVSEEHDDDGAAIYGQFARWGRNLGVSEMEVGWFTDVGAAQIGRVIGEVKKRPVLLVKAPFAPKKSS